MRTTLQGLWKARRGRRIVAATIAPFVEQSRRRLNIPAQTWLEPYVVGFMMMLITDVANRRLAPIDSNTLALIQAETWEEITGLTANLVAEETVRLSTMRDPLFESGCRNAIVLGDALCWPSSCGRMETVNAWSELYDTLCWSTPHTDGSPTTLGGGENAINDLWETFFEGHVAMPQRDDHPPGNIER